MITEPTPRRHEVPRRARHVKLGRRLEVLQLIHAGRISSREAAVLMDIPEQEVQRWQSVHAGDEMVAIGRMRAPPRTREELHLLARRGRLVRLLRSVEASLRDLHARLLETTRETGSTMA